MSSSFALRRLAAGIMAITSVLAATGCATKPPEPDPVMPQPDHAWPIAQVEEPRRLRFVVCSDCPQRTPKTLPGQAVTADARTSMSAPARSAPMSSSPPAPVAAQQDKRFVATVNFALNSSKLRPIAQQQLDALLPVLVFATDVQVTGFTDDLGPPALNQRLALARASAVVHALKPALGARDRHDGDAPLPTPQGRPLCCYLTDNRSEAERATNRRAELVFRIPAEPQALRAAAGADPAARLRELPAVEPSRGEPAANNKP
jgi:outer membrane protein OmpA-like peptidoglycan-associated protein